ncbi:hypothetical protein BHM03_00056154 [Ensete ventricosum]|nr:hypothetical protein BHM03_00056154 [Ensete ventricosum]
MWLSCDVAEMGTLCSSPRWIDHYWPHHSLPHHRNPFRCYFMGRTCKSYVGVWIAAKRIATKLFDLLGGVARKLFGSGVMDMWRLAVA